jgi:hypothetical protein
MNHRQRLKSGEKCVGRYDLREGQLLRISRGQGVRVQVSKGRVWITEEGVFDDVFIGAGSWFRLLRPGTAVIEAMTRSDILLTSSRTVDDAMEIGRFPRPVPHAGIVGQWWRGARVAARVVARRAWRAIQPLLPVRAFSAGRLRSPGVAGDTGRP